MALFHSLFSRLADAVKPAADKVKNEIPHDSYMSMRTLAVVAFVGYLLWVSKMLLTPENLKLCAYMIGLLIICNTITKLGTIAANGWIKVTEIKEFSKDNDLSDKEAEIIGKAASPTAT